MTEKNSHLVITALGPDRPGLVSEVSKAIFDCGCTIDDSRMIALGGEFAVIIKIAGSWDKIAKLESNLTSLARQIDLTINVKRTNLKKGKPTNLPYAIDVVSMDHPGIVYQLANFLSKRGINIEEMNTSTYSAAHTGTPMFSVHIRIWIPSDMSISDMRDAFFEKCDELNIDAVMEPIKS